eukprot:7377264-Prymnesium_polylepis.1
MSGGCAMSTAIKRRRKDCLPVRESSVLVQLQDLNPGRDIDRASSGSARSTATHSKTVFTITGGLANALMRAMSDFLTRRTDSANEGVRVRPPHSEASRVIPPLHTRTGMPT